MTESRSFPLCDILSVTTGALVSRERIGGVYKVLSFMVGEDLYTHQLPRASDTCAPELIRQHPWLARIEAPDFSQVHRDDVEAAVYRWVDLMDMTHGGHHDVEPCPQLWQRKDALAELDQMAGTRPVISVHVQGGSGV